MQIFVFGGRLFSALFQAITVLFTQYDKYRRTPLRYIIRYSPIVFGRIII